MDAWWQSLNLPLQIFYVIGGVAGILLVIEAVMSFVGMSHHHDMDVATDHPDDFGIISIRTLTGFFFGFGWTGVISIKSGANLIIAIILATIVGLAFLFGIYLLMRALFSLRESGTLDYKNAIGQTGTVYATVPPSREGIGQIEVLIQGRLQVIGSMTSDSEALSPGTKVKVVDTIDQGTLEITKL